MIREDQFNLQSSPYPYLVTDHFCSPSDLERINFEHSKLFQSEIKTWAGGQESRENIVVTRNCEFMQDYSHLYPTIVSLFNSLDSLEFRSYLYRAFKGYLSKNAFTGKQIKAFFESDLEVQLCRSVDGYENPIHVDTRKRVVHALLYLNHNNLVGGEFDIIKYRHAKQSWEYPQFADTMSVEKILRFSPNNNRSIFILSTPNSYHRGVKSSGTRNFLYIAYNYSEVAWKQCASWQNPKPFKTALDNQKKREAEYLLPSPMLMSIKDNMLTSCPIITKSKPIKSARIGTDQTLIEGLMRNKYHV